MGISVLCSGVMTISTTIWDINNQSPQSLPLTKNYICGRGKSTYNIIPSDVCGREVSEYYYKKLKVTQIDGKTGTESAWRSLITSSSEETIQTLCAITAQSLNGLWFAVLQPLCPDYKVLQLVEDISLMWRKLWIPLREIKYTDRYRKGILHV